MNRERAIAAVLVTAAVVAAGCGTDAAPEPAAEATAAPPAPGTGPSTTGTLAGTVTADSTSSSTSSSTSNGASGTVPNGQRPPRHEATIVLDAGTVHASLVDGRLEVRLAPTTGWTSQMERTGTSATIRLTAPAPTPTAETATVSTVEVIVEATAHGISHRVASHAGGDHITWRSAAEASVSSGDDDGP